MSAEADMVAAMFHRAMLDACGAGVASERGEAAKSLRTSFSQAYEAWRFLTDSAGPWAESRAWWAGLVGVDPAIVRDAAIAAGPNRQVLAAKRWLAEVDARKAEQAAEQEAKAARRAMAAERKAEMEAARVAREAAARAKAMVKRSPKARREDVADRRLLALRKQGKSWREIAAAMHRSLSAVKDRARKLGMTGTQDMKEAA
jgi:DNA-binding NarL/FixJ family response regulator